ncbi:MAG TPA: PKD domain-containing protein [Thermoplasmatales archaeon]|nr:PKD domain-containing protein [Thermoplasmatales archaeon]
MSSERGLNLKMKVSSIPSILLVSMILLPVSVSEVLGTLQPKVEILYPPDNAILYNQTVVVTGYASSRESNLTLMIWSVEGEIGSYTRNSTIDPPTRFMNFMIPVSLFPGRNIITVTFIDECHLEGSDSVLVLYVSNTPPSIPGKPSGPTSGEVGVTYRYTTNTSDPDGDRVRYGWDWNGDNIVDEWSEFLESGSLCSTSHTWSEEGVYHVKVKAQDEYGLESGWSENLTVTIVSSANQPPFTPTITGPTTGRVGNRYEYTFNAVDPEGDKIYYYIDWGDNTSSGWIGPYSSGEDVIVSHSFSVQGTYTVRAKARDVSGAESNWGELVVTMPYYVYLQSLLRNSIFTRFLVLLGDMR